MHKNIREIIIKELSSNDGILQMKPCWVSREYLPAGKRLGLKEEEYSDGNRGDICERWIVSETQADNKYVKEHEGQSYLKLKTITEDILLVEALDSCKTELLGEEYAKKHTGLNRLLKIFDYKTSLFYHIHQRQEDAKKVGRNGKDEAYYFLDAPLGSFPITFFGIHPYIYEQNLQEELFIPYLNKWTGNSILRNSRGYMNIPGEGFHLEAGILHGPGTALTLELQESSDVMAILQADIDGIMMNKDMMFKDIEESEVKSKGVKAVLDQIDWKASADPYFYENHHLLPLSTKDNISEDIDESWIWYNSTKFNGTRIIIQPGASYISKALGVHGLFVWKGSGQLDDFNIQGQTVSLEDSNDEFLISHEKALKGVNITNNGQEQMVIFKFFGPDINNKIVPMIKPKI